MNSKQKSAYGGCISILYWILLIGLALGLTLPYVLRVIDSSDALLVINTQTVPLSQVDSFSGLDFYSTQVFAYVVDTSVESLSGKTMTDSKDILRNINFDFTIYQDELQVKTITTRQCNSPIDFGGSTKLLEKYQDKAVFCSEDKLHL